LNIYVGNIPRDTNEEAVRELFSKHGEVGEVKLIKDQYSGELRGFGFIEMSDKSEAQTAIKEVNGTDLAGRRLVVNEARPRNESSNNRSRNSGFNGSNSRSW
jgi:RNA recognition motif-containing protein